MVAVGVHRDGSRSLLGTAAAPLPGFVKAPAGGGNDYSEVEDYNELSGVTATRPLRQRFSLHFGSCFGYMNFVMLLVHIT